MGNNQNDLDFGLQIDIWMTAVFHLIRFFIEKAKDVVILPG